MNNSLIADELWVDLTDYEGLYKISNHGRIRSLDRTIVERNTGRSINKKGKTLKPIIADGYIVVRLGKGGIIRSYRLSRLIALHFVPGRSKKKCVTNHKDGNKLNNIASNLEWCSIGYNLKHAYELGLKKPTNGTNHYLTKLTDDQVRSIKRMLRDKASVKEIANAMCITYGIVYAISTGRSWKHINI